MIIEDPDLQIEIARRISGIELRLGQFELHGASAELRKQFTQYNDPDIRDTLAFFIQLRQLIYDTKKHFYTPKPEEYASESDYDMSGMTDCTLAKFPQASRNSVQYIVKKCVYWMHLR